MTLKKLFTELGNKTKAAEPLFEQSGMLNKYQKLDFGFFPLGSGFLSDDLQIEQSRSVNSKIMVLGNDFGTDNYLTTKCKGNRESSSNPTIYNLLTKLNLDTSNTFFTNFYLGVRKHGTNTKRVIQLRKEYKELCFNFFITQLEIINPEIILCLGHEVRIALAENSDLFSDWTRKSVTLKELYSNKKHQIYTEDQKIGNRKFIVIPHPCDRRNFNQLYVNDILEAMKL